MGPTSGVVKEGLEAMCGDTDGFILGDMRGRGWKLDKRGDSGVKDDLGDSGRHEDRGADAIMEAEIEGCCGDIANAACGKGTGAISAFGESVSGGGGGDE